MENILANQVKAKTSSDWLSSFPALFVELRSVFGTASLKKLAL